MTPCHLMINGSINDPYEVIRYCFNKLKPGESVIIQSPHRDMHEELGKDGRFFILPDRHEIPHTFSLKQIIQDALISVCPEVDKDFEEIDFSRIPQTEPSKMFPTSPDELQGFWKFLDLKIEDNYIHATIKKI